MGSKQFENKAHRSFWSVHIEAWGRSGLSRADYCRQHRLPTRKFSRWLNHLIGEEECRKHAEYLRELKREEARRRAARQRWPHRLRYGARTDTRSPAVRAFWAMHVEAMNWSGMGIHEYASALRLSPHALRKWRNRFEDGEAVVDWRSLLHPSARARLSSAAKERPPRGVLTAAQNADGRRDGRSNRRSFTEEQKLAIVLETEEPDVSVAEVCRRHGIATSMAFRWRVQFGLSERKEARLATVALSAGQVNALSVLQDLVQPPEGMTAVELDNGRRVFAPAGSDAADVKRHVARRESAP